MAIGTKLVEDALHYPLRLCALLHFGWSTRCSLSKHFLTSDSELAFICD